MFTVVVSGARRLRQSLSTRFDLIRRLSRYAAVSIVTSIVVLSVLGVLVGVVDAAAGWSNVVATLAGIALSFELNRRWAWEGRSNGPTAVQIVSFATMNLTGLGLSTVAVHTVAVMATQHHLTRLVRTGAVEGVNIAAWGALWVIQFLVLDRFVFRPRGLPVASTAALTASSIDGEHVKVG